MRWGGKSRGIGVKHSLGERRGWGWAFSSWIFAPTVLTAKRMQAREHQKARLGLQRNPGGKADTGNTWKRTEKVKGRQEGPDEMWRRGGNGGKRKPSESGGGGEDQMETGRVRAAPSRAFTSGDRAACSERDGD